MKTYDATELASQNGYSEVLRMAARVPQDMSVANIAMTAGHSSEQNCSWAMTASGTTLTSAPTVVKG